MVNDVTIIGSIITIFILIGGFLPFVQAEFNTTIDNNDPEQFERRIGDDVREARDNETVTGIYDIFSVGAQGVTFLNVMFSIVMMFFWSFNGLPFWLNLLFIPIRIILVLIIARNIWIGGGG